MQQRSLYAQCEKMPTVSMRFKSNHYQHPSKQPNFDRASCSSQTQIPFLFSFLTPRSSGVGTRVFLSVAGLLEHPASQRLSGNVSLRWLLLAPALGNINVTLAVSPIKTPWCNVRDGPRCSCKLQSCSTYLTWHFAASSFILAAAENSWWFSLLP